MSKVLKEKLNIEGVEIKQLTHALSFKGSFGEFVLKLHKEIEVEISESDKLIKVIGNASNMLKGTFTRLIKNAIFGVKTGFEKKVKLQGVGYKAAVEGNRIKFTVGLSHDKYMEIPQGIIVKMINIANLSIKSCDKEKLGTFTDKICKMKKYNVYNGNGILDLDKTYRRKATKKK